jgi:hypothetical protein
MYCKNCGRQIDNDSSFCSYCGTRQSIQSEHIDNSNTEQKADAKTVNVNLSFGRQSIQKPKKEVVIIEKYDNSYQKETQATAVGVILITINFGVLLMGGIKDASLYSAVLIFGLFLRVIVSIWCANIAKRQNREPFGWGLSAFLFPSITLIIIGLLKKLKNKDSGGQDINRVDSQIDKTEINRIVLKETSEGKALQIHTSLSVGYKIGDKVTIDGKSAPDGKYKVGFMDNLIVEDGMIKRV